MRLVEVSIAKGYALNMAGDKATRVAVHFQLIHFPKFRPILPKFTMVCVGKLLSILEVFSTLDFA